MNKIIFFSLTGKRWERNIWSHRVATFLRTQDWDAEVVDFTSFWQEEQLQAFVKSRVNNNVVAFVFATSFLNPYSVHLNQFLSWLKTTYPNIPIVVGGQNALVTPAEPVDFWIDSYGENALLNLCRFLIGTKTTPLSFDTRIKDKKVIRGLHAYPSAPLESYLIDYEKRDFLKEYECPQVETSRGCMFQCSYCNFPILGQAKDVSISADEFQLQLKLGYDKWGIKNWRFIDETFNDRPEKIIKYADVVEKLSFTPWFTGFARGDLVVLHKKYWDDYLRLGFLGHSMGIETFSSPAGKLIRKGIDPDRLKQGLLDFQTYTDKYAPRRYRGQINLICGLPLETEESWYNTLEWLNSNWLRQSSSAWILEISEAGIDLSNDSTFTRDLKHAGIKQMESSRANPGYDVTRNEKGQIVFKSIIGGGVGTTRLDNIVIWEHNEMNWYRAQELVKEFYDKNKGFKGKLACNPILSDRLFVYYKTTEYESIYDKLITKIDTADEIFINFVNDYIENKLNWKE